MTHIVATYDANDPRMQPHRGQEYIHEFLDAHGIDWMQCARFDVLADGDGAVQAYMFPPEGGWRPTEEFPTVVVPLCAPVPPELNVATWSTR